MEEWVFNCDAALVLGLLLCEEPSKKPMAYMSHRTPGVCSGSWMNRTLNTLWLLMAVGIILPKYLLGAWCWVNSKENDRTCVKNISILCKRQTKIKNTSTSFASVGSQEAQNHGPIGLVCSWSPADFTLAFLTGLPSSGPAWFCSSFLHSTSSHSFLHAPQGCPPTSKCTCCDDSLLETIGGSQHLHYREKAWCPRPALLVLSAAFCASHSSECSAS